ncbi:hypothetical protein SAY87_018194 [Trapa incisa]|uniref:Cytochrome b5 heme-binding domain-containing protein n=1 Tax=Trapa incisa TaxID=236973 RepID=A0AAN7QTK1_9MYRT|nr:hypothetical protein SAY87_018194 [Trapa incisa]
MEAMLLAGIGVMLVVLGAFLLLPRNPKSSKRREIRANAGRNKEWKVYSRDEVSLHKKRDDCWIIIKDRVYDVTPYVEEHPGGDAILAHAGDDSTRGFYGPQHGTRVFDIIEDFYIGDLKM